ncbi:MAG: adenylate synthase [Gammaproteobacteria bacterium]|nr:MAG: adenylate synthase [Gammaproteobacteria bacterium]
MKTSNLAFLHGFFSAKHFTSREKLQRFQQRQLHKILTQHGTRFYPNSDKLSDFPIINKRIFMQHFADINIANISEKAALDVAMQAENSRDFSPLLATDQGEFIVGLSSGTSGSRGVFLVSPKESARWAGYMCRRLLPKPYLRPHRIAFFLRANSNLYESVRGRLIDFCFYDLLTPLARHIDTLNCQRPSVLIAPAKVLHLLSQDKRLNIAPEKIISVAEVLEPPIKAEIEARFSQTVHQVYQCTEGFLAHTCPHGNLHLNEDLVFIEKDWLDKDTGRFAPIITDFNRRTQPLIRYRLDDILVADDRPCACGSVFTRLKAIEGRCDDILFAKTVDNQDYTLFPDFVRRALISVPYIQDYRVAQHGDCLHIALNPLNTQTKQATEKALKAMCEKHHIQAFILQFKAYEPRPLHEKQRRILRV